MNHIRVLLLAIGLVAFGCQKNVDPVEVTHFFIDEEEQPILRESIGVSEGCGGFLLQSIDFNNTLFIYNLRIQLTPTGRLVAMGLRTREGERYEIQSFNSSDFVNVSEFNYDKVRKEVSFSVAGKLFSSSLNKSINISGHFEKLAVKTYECNKESSTFLGELQGASESFLTETLSSTSAIRSTLGENAQVTYLQNFLLTNALSLHFESPVSYKNLPVGTYTLGQPDAITVSLKEYKGLSNPITFNSYVRNDWRDFKVEGSLTISRQYVVNGTSYTEGTISFQADNESDHVRYVLSKGDFTLLNLD
ncbi:hypothetical protein GCM10027275_08100 [Rhabdobacter roseus]